jgi:hypothetical protein
MIAANYRKHPEALAVQLALDFGAILRWATARPGSRVLRAIRAARTAAMKAHTTVAPWFGPVCIEEKKQTPRWLLVKSAAARALGKAVRLACTPLFIA